MDFRLDDHGSIAVLTPLTDGAREWVDENIQVEQTWGGGIVIEHRYVGPILEGIVDAGFTL